MPKQRRSTIPNLSPRRPSRKHDEAVLATPPSSIPSIGAEGTRRLVADLPASIYHALHERCKERSITKRDYLIELLRRDGLA